MDSPWSKAPAFTTRRTLTILVSWLGADAPLPESDIRALVDTRLKVSGRRVTQFLEARGLLIPDPEFRRDTHQTRLEAELAALPETIAQELSVWIKVVRGEGKWEPTGRTYRSIFRYFQVLGVHVEGPIHPACAAMLACVRSALARSSRSRSPNARRWTTTSGVEAEAREAFGMVTRGSRPRARVPPCQVPPKGAVRPSRQIGQFLGCDDGRSGTGSGRGVAAAGDMPSRMRER